MNFKPSQFNAALASTWGLTGLNGLVLYSALVQPLFVPAISAFVANPLFLIPSLALNYNVTSQTGYNNTYDTTGDSDPTIVGGARAGGSYQEVILIDILSNALLYTAIIDFERNTTGFNGKVWDFQMIVPEDGHGTDTATTEYNFYLELE